MNYFGFYQELLVSGSNIKTLTSQSMLGSGDYKVLMQFGGTGWSLQVPDNTTTGGNARGTGAVDLQVSRSAAAQVASGAGSLVSGINSTASGAASAAFGYYNSATGNYSIAFGAGNISYAVYSTSFGASNISSGNYATVFGNSNVADGASSTVFGSYSTSNTIQGKIISGCATTIGTVGAAQAGWLILAARTIDATPVLLTTNNIPGTPTVNNQATLINNSAHNIMLDVVARDTSSGDMATWRVSAAAKRGANASTTAIVGTPSITMTFNDAGATAWSGTITADTTRGAIAFTAIGEAGKTIDWTAKLSTVEVI